MTYWNFEYTKFASLHYGKSGEWWYGQGPATEVIHLRLNQPSVFFSSEARVVGLRRWSHVTVWSRSNKPFFLGRYNMSVNCSELWFQVLCSFHDLIMTCDLITVKWPHSKAKYLNSLIHRPPSSFLVIQFVFTIIHSRSVRKMGKGWECLCQMDIVGGEDGAQLQIHVL